jgi:hypothetical protein
MEGAGKRKRNDVEGEDKEKEAGPNHATKEGNEEVAPHAKQPKMDPSPAPAVGPPRPTGEASSAKKQKKKKGRATWFTLQRPCVPVGGGGGAPVS